MKQLLILLLIALLPLMSFAPGQQESTIRFGLLKYKGGGDWYSNKETSLPNLINFCNEQLNMNIDVQQKIVEPGDPEIFNLPFIHMTGHGNVVFSKQEAENLRDYLIGGGFLHIDDNYGMDPYIRKAMKNVFPEHSFVELPFSHAIYKQKFSFPTGLPKIHEHDKKPPQGFGLIHQGKLVCFYTYECDLGDGWENPAVHNDPERVHQQALQMGANIVQFAFTQ